MRTFQILIDGFAISALYALGATGFTLIFGVSGVLNLSHGAIMVAAAVAAWAAASVLHMDTYSGALVGVAVALIISFATYFAVVKPIQNSRRAANSTAAISSRSIRTSASSPITTPRRPGRRSPA